MNTYRLRISIKNGSEWVYEEVKADKVEFKQGRVTFKTKQEVDPRFGLEALRLTASYPADTTTITEVRYGTT